MSLNAISCACRLRPEVWMWYLSFLRALVASYLCFIALAQIRRATRPITAVLGSMPLEKKNDRLGAKSSIAMPRER